MIVFVDFEASSLGRHGFPVEVGWVFETGEGETHLIRPASGWEEWSAEAEATHGLSRARLEQEGEPHDVVACRMMDALAGHQAYASAPSWDGQWLSRLLRAAGLPRHALRLRDTEEAQADAALAALEAAGAPEAQRRREVAARLVAEVTEAARRDAPAHRALDDARRELWIWEEVRVRAARWARGEGEVA